MTFADFLAPRQMHAYERSMYLMLDDKAAAIGQSIKDSHPTPNEMRRCADVYRKRELLWLSEINYNTAGALDKDVRIAALPMLYATCSQTWTNWYSTLLREHVEYLLTIPPRADRTVQNTGAGHDQI